MANQKPILETPEPVEEFTQLEVPDLEDVLLSALRRQPVAPQPEDED